MADKAYYAVIPAEVRYDKELTPNAKLLYGEITALCNEKGYCWATNEYFANLYGVSKITISKWINQLVKKGYIHSEMIYKEGTKEIISRYLKIKDTPINENFNTHSTEVKDPIKENFNTPINEKFKENNTDINNTLNITYEESRRSQKFIKPTIEEIEAYCRERDNGIDAQQFYDFYEAKGWLIGKTKMKDWKAAVRTWERRNQEQNAKSNASSKSNYKKPTYEGDYDGD
jgi:DNA-binding transcriptional ArsR family regulator